MRILPLVLVPLALAGGKQAPADHAAVTKDEAAKIAEQAEANFTTGNVDDVMRQYADGAVSSTPDIPASAPTERSRPAGHATS